MKQIVFLLVVLFPMIGLSQSNGDIPFNGVIYDSGGKAAKRARIYVENKNRYALSDKQGRFGLTNVKPTDTLHVRYGGKFYAIPVDGRRSISIRLADQSQFQANEDDKLYDMGFYYVKNRERTNSGSVITGEELVNTGRSDLLEALRGKVPGLTMIGGGIGGDTRANIRGISSPNGTSEPLYIVDGMTVPTLSGISVYSVDRVEIVKDSNIYGASGGNGAIVVYTKRGSNR